MPRNERIFSGKVLMLGSYDPQFYSRGRILYKSLQHQNVAADLFLPKGFGKYFRMIQRLLKKDFEVVIANGKPVLLLCWAMKWFHKKKILFDVFISDFDTLVFDRKLVKPTSLRAKFLWWLDRFCCRRADLNMLDTEEHIDYFVDEFGLPSSSFVEVPVGADDEVFYPQAREGKREFPFLVHFHGTYIPLQGTEFIVRAAKLLENEGITFRMIGRGQEYGKIQKLVEKFGLRNMVFEDMVPLKRLVESMAEADLCLGNFGTTGKAQRVITNKCYEAMAMGKALITSKTPCAERLLMPGALLVACGSSESIAAGIQYLKKNVTARKQLEKQALHTFQTRFSIDRIGERLLQVYFIRSPRIEDTENIK